MQEQAELPLEEPHHQTHPSVVRGALSLLTEEELAGALCVTVDTLAKWRTKGVGPDYTKPGKRVFYRTDDVRGRHRDRPLAPPGHVPDRPVGAAAAGASGASLTALSRGCPAAATSGSSAAP